MGEFLKDEIKLQNTNTYDKEPVNPGVKILIIQIEENVMSTYGMKSHNCHSPAQRNLILNSTSVGSDKVVGWTTHPTPHKRLSHLCAT